METATLTKTEESHVERMAGAFAEPTVEEQFKEWAPRVLAHGKEQKAEKEKNAGPREISLKGRTEEERNYIEGSAQKVDDSAKESRRESSAERNATGRTEQHSDRDSASSHEQGKLTRTEADNHLRQITSGGHAAWGNALTKALDELPDGLRESVIGHIAAHSGDRQALGEVKTVQDLQGSVDKIAAYYRMSDMVKQTTAKHPDAAAKIKSATNDIVTKAPMFVQAFVNDSEELGELLYTLADPATLNNLLETAKTNPGKALRVLRDMELDIQKALSGERSRASRPRAPKPPSELSARGAAGGDGGETDFGSVSARMSQLYFQR